MLDSQKDLKLTAVRTDGADEDYKQYLDHR